MRSQEPAGYRDRPRSPLRRGLRDEFGSDGRPFRDVPVRTSTHSGGFTSHSGGRGAFFESPPTSWTPESAARFVDMLAPLVVDRLSDQIFHGRVTRDKGSLTPPQISQPDRHLASGPSTSSGYSEL